MKTLFYLILTFLLSAHHVLGQPYQVKKYYDADDKQIKEQYFVKDSLNPVLHGLYESFFWDGSIKTRGYYKNNTPDSLWMYFYENGGVRASGNIENGEKHGMWQFFFENGDLSMTGNIYGAKKEGIWKYYYENGTIKIEGKYQNNNKEGVWNYYYEDGALKAKGFFQNGSGIYKEYYNSGALKAVGLNKNGKSDSTWTYYYEDGTIRAKGEYDDGLKSGTWSFYHPNGHLSSEGKYNKGKKDGKWTYYHENGNISSEGALREGKKEGYWKLYNELGKFKGDGIFERGDGTYHEYYESGKLKTEGYIENGKNHGLWKYYYEDGNLEGKCQFQYGKGKFTGYYPDGSVYMKGTIKDGKNIGVWELYNPDGSLAGYYRPFYEGDKPVYKLVEEQKASNVERGKPGYLKPDYKYNPKKLRYFSPVVNEFKGVILATNPLSTFLGSIPLSFEYYFHERLGYEMQVSYLRKPFFKADDKVATNDIFSRGFDAAIRQKFYHQEQSFGMFYFAHELRFTNLNHKSNVIDSSEIAPTDKVIDAIENKVEYSITFGNRWLKTYGERYIKGSNTRGITIDAFIGIGIGYRSFTTNYEANENYDEIFSDLNQNNFAISPRLGINIGYIF